MKMKSSCLFIVALLLLATHSVAVSQAPYNHSLTPAQQQAIWYSEAYRFLNGGYYPYNYADYPMAAYPYYYSPYTYYYYPQYSSFRVLPYPVPTYATPAQTTTPTQAYPSGAMGYTIMTATNSALGTYLTDGSGRTLYHLQSDQGSYTSKCTDATCTGSWPPFYSGSISVPGNLNPADFSIITVSGSKQYHQTAFKGWPLYYFYQDTKPGDVYGQGLKDNYGVWSVVNPESPSTFPANFPYPSGGTASNQYQYPMQQPYTMPTQPTSTPQY
jgi:predicted lipoprotein with Yx(FWY)xxD motif